jgi:purine-binding chemotaxis protein CheW
MANLISQPRSEAPDAKGRQVLTFSLNGETYGVDILRVQEIRGWSAVNRIPQTPSHVLGVLNLRGTIVPIVDLRVHFNLPSAEFTPLTVIIVLSIRTARGSSEFGLVVDSVSDVVDVRGEDVKETPNMGNQHDSDFIESLATVNGHMLILLDVDALIGRDPSLQATDPFAGAA